MEFWAYFLETGLGTQSVNNGVENILFLMPPPLIQVNENERDKSETYYLELLREFNKVCTKLSQVQVGSAGCLSRKSYFLSKQIENPIPRKCPVARNDQFYWDEEACRYMLKQGAGFDIARCVICRTSRFQVSDRNSTSIDDTADMLGTTIRLAKSGDGYVVDEFHDPTDCYSRVYIGTTRVA